MRRKQTCHSCERRIPGSSSCTMGLPGWLKVCLTAWLPPDNRCIRIPWPHSPGHLPIKWNFMLSQTLEAYDLNICPSLSTRQQLLNPPHPPPQIPWKQLWLKLGRIWCKDCLSVFTINLPWDDREGWGEAVWQCGALMAVIVFRIIPAFSFGNCASQKHYHGPWPNEHKLPSLASPHKEKESMRKMQ